jgi:hypothetical protein
VRKLLLSILAVLVLLGGTNLLAAPNETKPLMVVSFSGHDQFIAHLGVLGRMGGQPEMGKSVDFMLQMMTQGKGLAGLDMKRPWGAAFFSDGPKANVFYGFLPVTDLKAMVELLKTNPQAAEKVQLKDGVYEIDADNKTIYLEQKDKWTLITDRRENLAAAPAEPEKLLGDLPKNYDLAVRLSVENMPKEYRDLLLAKLHLGAELGTNQMPNESDEQYALRSNVMKQASHRIATLFEELEYVTLGWNTDSSRNTTYFDVEMTARKGTALADRFALLKDHKTRFGGFTDPDAAVSACWTSILTDADVAEAKTNLAMLRKSVTKQLEDQSGLADEEQKLAVKLLGDLFGVMEKTAETKKKDGGMMLRLKPDAATLVVGTSVAEGKTLEKVLKTLVKELQKHDKGGIEIKFDAETHQGVRFHKFVVPNPKSELTPMVGDTIEIIVGIGDDRAFLAVGRNAADTLKKLIDQSKAAEGKEVPPLHISVATTAIAKFIAEFADDEEAKSNIAEVAETLEKAGGKSHILVTAKSVHQGIRVRVEFEEGILKAMLQIVPKMMMNLGIPGGMGMPGGM